jgi:uncharacterized circularly permuted ATP-grasp superfamily protein
MSKIQFYDEMHDSLGNGTVRAHYAAMQEWLSTQSPASLSDKRKQADLMFHKLGITFAVYGEETGAERLIPFDIIPRVFPKEEWAALEKGLRQRVLALNMFLHDVYHDHRIIKAGVIPAERIFANAQYRPEMQGVDVARQIYSHISGVDIVRAGAGEFYVLEDNLRVPSGVSYMLEDRKMMMRLFPDLFSKYKVAPVAHYPDMLLETLRSVAPHGIDDPTVVVMTPGAYISEYL